MLILCVALIALVVGMVVVSTGLLMHGFLGVGDTLAVLVVFGGFFVSR